MVIYLNGSINSGKSTVAKLLAKMISHLVVIEIDDLPCPDELPLDQKIQPLLEDATDLVIHWQRRGHHVLVVWPISVEDHRNFCARLTKIGVEVQTFTLAPKLDIALSNRGQRELTEWEKQRIPFHYASGIASPPFGVILDNSTESPETTAKRIIEMLKHPLASR